MSLDVCPMFMSTVDLKSSNVICKSKVLLLPLSVASRKRIRKAVANPHRSGGRRRGGEDPFRHSEAVVRTSAHDGGMWTARFQRLVATSTRCGHRWAVAQFSGRRTRPSRRGRRTEVLVSALTGSAVAVSARGYINGPWAWVSPRRNSFGDQNGLCSVRTEHVSNFGMLNLFVLQFLLVYQ